MQSEIKGLIVFGPLKIKSKASLKLAACDLLCWTGCFPKFHMFLPQSSNTMVFEIRPLGYD